MSQAVLFVAASALVIGIIPSGSHRELYDRIPGRISDAVHLVSPDQLADRIAAIG